MTSDFAPEWFSPPGSTLSMMTARRGISTRQLAATLQEDIAFVLRLLAGTERIEKQLANLLAENVGATPEFWASRQARSDTSLNQTARNISSDAAAAWLRSLPLKDMRSAGWIVPAAREHSLPAALAYFGVTSPTACRPAETAHMPQRSGASSP